MDSLAVLVEAGTISAATAFAVVHLYRYLDSVGLKQPALSEAIKTVTPTEERPTVRDMETPTVVDMETSHMRYMDGPPVPDRLAPRPWRY